MNSPRTRSFGPSHSFFLPFFLPLSRSQVTWEECKKVSCWFFWDRYECVPVTSGWINVPPPAGLEFFGLEGEEVWVNPKEWKGHEAEIAKAVKEAGDKACEGK